MQTKYLCVLIHIWIKGEVGPPLNRFKPSSKIFFWPFQGGTSFVDLLCFCSVLCLLSFVVSNCEFVTFPLVSWVGCGTWLYRSLIFALLLTLTNEYSVLLDNLVLFWIFIAFSPFELLIIPKCSVFEFSVTILSPMFHFLSVGKPNFSDQFKKIVKRYIRSL